MSSVPRFLDDALSNRHNRAILERWPRLGLRDGWLVAGCLFQSVWNRGTGRPPEASIKDHDLFYYDPANLCAAAEAEVQRHVEHELGDLGIVVEAKNQARVHLWYEDHFGHPYAPLQSAREGIERFLVLCTCVGVRPAAQGYDVCAPYGLADLYAGVLKPNPLVDRGTLFRDKAASYRGRWPWLQVKDG